MNLLTSYINHQAIAVVDTKADTAATNAKTAATKAAVTEKTTDVIAAINLGYEARRTESPDDMAKAQAAEAKVMAQRNDEPN